MGKWSSTVEVPEHLACTLYVTKVNCRVWSFLLIWPFTINIAKLLKWLTSVISGLSWVFAIAFWDWLPFPSCQLPLSLCLLASDLPTPSSSGRSPAPVPTESSTGTCTLHIPSNRLYTYLKSFPCWFNTFQTVYIQKIKTILAVYSHWTGLLKWNVPSLTCYFSWFKNVAKGLFCFKDKVYAEKCCWIFPC